MAHPPVTRRALLSREAEWMMATGSDMRVKAYNLNGDRVGVAGVGEGAQRLTFPSKLTVDRILGFQHWIKEAPAGGPKWYEILGDWKPTRIVFINGTVANPEDPVGMCGDTVWVVDTTPSYEEYYEDEKPLIDLTELRTPRTPSDGFGD